MSQGNIAGFDAEDAPDFDFDVIPLGEYDLMITESEMKGAAEGSAVMLNTTVTIISGKYINRKVWTRTNYIKKDGTVNPAGKSFLAGAAKALGILRPNDTSELHDKPLRGKIRIYLDEYNGVKTQKNEVVKFLPRGNSNAAPNNAPRQSEPQKDAPKADASAWNKNQQ